MADFENILKRFDSFADSVVLGLSVKLTGSAYRITMEVSTIDDFDNYKEKLVLLSFADVSEYRLVEDGIQIFNLALGIVHVSSGDEHFFDFHTNEGEASLDETRQSNFYIRCRNATFEVIDQENSVGVNSGQPFR